MPARNDVGFTTHFPTCLTHEDFRVAVSLLEHGAHKSSWHHDRYKKARINYFKATWRLLLLARYKEDRATCALSHLPIEILRHIMHYVFETTPR